jgi:hypothetical protein
MTAFLSWIYSQAVKVYDWFGAGYYALRNAASSAWEWAVSQAAVAYNAARNYAYQLMLGLDVGIGLFKDYLLSQLRDVRDGLLEDVRGLFEWVEYKLGSLQDLIQSVVNTSMEGFWNVVDDVRNFATLSIDNAVGYLQTWVDGLVGWVLNIRRSLFDLVSLFNPSRIQEFLILLDQWKRTALVFFDDPLGFIFDVMQEKFLSFLDYVLGWALGTTIYDLPSGKSWKVG